MPQTREEFLAERRTGIGGSDAAALFSIGYSCHRRLVYDKRGTKPDYEPLDKNVFKRGIALEPIAAQEYADATGRTLSTTVVIRHPRHPELLVHADRWILKSEEHGETPGVLEIKTSGREVFRKLQKEGMADEHTLQVQHALMCTGLSWGSYANLHPDSFDMVYFDMERNEEIITELQAQALDTWKMVTEGPLPEPLEPSDRRCLSCPWRITCQGKAMMDAIGESAKLDHFDESVAPALEQYVAAQQIVKNSEELLNDARETLEQHMQNRTLVKTIGGSVSWQPHKQLRVDAERLKKKFPAIYKQVLKEGIVRPLRVWPDGKGVFE